MGLSNELFTIRISQNEATLALSLNDYEFYIAANSGREVFTDEDIKPDEKGRYMIDLTPLGLGHTEVPKDVMEYRAKIREVNALKKNVIFIDRNVGKCSRYFYQEDEQLRVLQGDNEITGEVETIYGKHVIKADGLGLDEPYLLLPSDVARKFEGILKKKEIQKITSKLTLLLAGRSLIVVSTDLLP